MSLEVEVIARVRMPGEKPLTVIEFAHREIVPSMKLGGRFSEVMPQEMGEAGGRIDRLLAEARESVVAQVARFAADVRNSEE